MKKPSFWKVIVSLLVICLFLLAWMGQWRYEENGQIRVNRITSKVFQLQSDGKWKTLQQLREERAEAEREKNAKENKALEDFLIEKGLLNKNGSRKPLNEDPLIEKGLVNTDGSINHTKVVEYMADIDAKEFLKEHRAPIAEPLKKEPAKKREEPPK